MQQVLIFFCVIFASIQAAYIPQHAHSIRNRVNQMLKNIDVPSRRLEVQEVDTTTHFHAMMSQSFDQVTDGYGKGTNEIKFKVNGVSTMDLQTFSKNLAKKVTTEFEQKCTEIAKSAELSAGFFGKLLGIGGSASYTKRENECVSKLSTDTLEKLKKVTGVAASSLDGAMELVGAMGWASTPRSPFRTKYMLSLHTVQAEGRAINVLPSHLAMLSTNYSIHEMSKYFNASDWDKFDERMIGVLDSLNIRPSAVALKTKVSDQIQTCNDQKNEACKNEHADGK